MNSKNVRLTLHVAGCALLLSAFLVVSAPTVGRALWENKIDMVGPNHSIDRYLLGLTGMTNGAEKLSAVFEQLPSQEPLVIFVREEHAQSGFLGMLVAYLSWPREVRLVNVQDQALEAEVTAIQPASISALVFCSLNPPPWLGRTVRLGRDIVLVPVSASDIQP